MKNLNLKIIGIIFCSLIAPFSFSQGNNWTINGNNNTNPINNYLGTSNNFGLSIRTNGTERMRINANTGATAGFVGINTTNPLYQLHVNASGIANNQLWKRGIMLSDLAALTWHGAPNTNRHYFMGHSSVNPAGNFYQGYSEGIGIGALVNYASTVFVTSNPSSGPIASTQMFKWLFVHEDGFERRFGINTLNPIRTAEIKNTISNNWQLRLTHQNNAWTDFKTRNTGNLNIQPQNGNTGFNMNLNPTHTIDVNGNARIRNTPVAAIPQSIIIGQQVGVANDRELQRLDFTGNPNDVLLGNGTWGTVQTNLTANNGISINAANQIQLGVPCNVNGFPNLGGILANQFTEDRIITNRNHNFWIASANTETGGIGLGGQPVLPFCNTGNTVEISANMKNTKYGNTNASGLRFTRLTSASPTIANTINGVNNTKVLTVDSDGDVVLTDAIGSFGSICGSATPSQLTGNSEIQLNNFDFHFSGPSVASPQFANNVGINTNCANPLAAKLHVNQFSSDFGTTGTYILNTDATAFATSSNSSIGLYVENAGVTQDLASCHTVAAWFETDVNVDGSQNLAICVPQSGGQVSFGFNAANAAALNAQPDVCGIMTNSTAILEVNGNIYSTGFVTISDINVKTNIAPITSALDKVKKLNGVYFNYNNANYPNLSLSSDRQVGLIAQNVDTVLTEVTTYDSTLLAFTLDYSKINALLVEAIKEQDSNIDSLKNELSNQDSINTDLENRLATLEACINNIGICNNNGGGNGNKISTQTITLENSTAIVLDQNLPNPFAESTQINFVIPDDVLNAKLLFYDMSGRIINEVNINERGKGTLTVYGENLEKGIYTYSLIADGKLIATKKMVKK